MKNPAALCDATAETVESPRQFQWVLHQWFVNRIMNGDHCLVRGAFYTSSRFRMDTDRYARLSPFVAAICGFSAFF